MYGLASIIWVLIPLGGLAVGAWAIWNGSQHKQKALEVLKVYAEQGKEPPQAVLDALAADSPYYRAKGPAAMKDHLSPDPRIRSAAAWARFALFGVLAAGFAGVALWMQGAPGTGGTVFAFYITAFCLAAVAASSLVWAITASRSRDDR